MRRAVREVFDRRLSFKRAWLERLWIEVGISHPRRHGRSIGNMGEPGRL
jgi:hypothetical protein